LKINVVSFVSLPLKFENDRRKRALEEIQDVVNQSDRTFLYDMNKISETEGTENMEFKSVLYASQAILGQAVKKLCNMMEGPFFSTLVKDSYTIAYASDADSPAAVRAAMNMGMFGEEPPSGKVVVCSDAKLTDNEKTQISHDVTVRTAVYPEIVSGNGEGRGVLLFIPLSFRRH